MIKLAHTVERAGLVISLIMSGGLLAETIRAKVEDEPNRATKTDVAIVNQKQTETSGALDLVVAKQAEMDPIISQLQEDTFRVTYRDCILENVMRGIIGGRPVSYKTCQEEGDMWIKQNELDLEDSN